MVKSQEHLQSNDSQSVVLALEYVDDDDDDEEELKQVHPGGIVINSSTLSLS